MACNSMVFFIGDDVGMIKPQKERVRVRVCVCDDGRRNARIYNNSASMIDISLLSFLVLA